MNIDYVNLLQVWHQVIANRLRIPIDYLNKKWGYTPNIEKHFFNDDGSAIWKMDIKTWTDVTSAYIDWMLLTRDGKKSFFRDLYNRSRKSRDWATADRIFKSWLASRL